MSFNAVDQDLFQGLKEIMRESVAFRNRAYTRKASLEATSKHYLVVREGPNHGHRKVVLYSREALLLKRGNPSRVAMIELALASIDPVHHAWPKHYKRLLMETGGTRGMDQFQGRRWSKKILREIEVFMLQEDSTFRAREAAEAAKQNSSHSFSQKMCAHVQAAGFKVSGITEENGVAFPMGHQYTFELSNNDKSIYRHQKVVSFRPRIDGCVRAAWGPTKLSASEFERFVSLLGEINRERQLASQETNHES